MNIVDTHVHASRFCYAPVESLLYQMNVSRVEQTVLIQIEGGMTIAISLSARGAFRDATRRSSLSSLSATMPCRRSSFWSTRARPAYVCGWGLALRARIRWPCGEHAMS